MVWRCSTKRRSLVAWNRKFQEMLDVPDDVLAERRTYADYIRYLTERGEYGPDVDPDEQIRALPGACPRTLRPLNARVPTGG